jgi:hypothetical protein
MGWTELLFNLVLCLCDLVNFAMACHDLSKRA